LQAGKFKSPIGLEQLQADVDTLFNERALRRLVPNRDSALNCMATFLWSSELCCRIFNGVGDARNSSNLISKMTRRLKAAFSSSRSRNPLPGFAEPRIWVGWQFTRICKNECDDCPARPAHPADLPLTAANSFLRIILPSNAVWLPMASTGGFRLKPIITTAFGLMGNM